MWTTEDKAGIGKAGVALLCKEKPERVWFGVGDEGKDLVGRVVRAEFKDTVVVATYHPQGGFTGQTLAEKAEWERQLAGWIRKVSSHSKPVVWGGDFNVNPYRDDWTQRAWQHLRGKIGNRDPAGCREIEGNGWCEFV
jgi:exonuclease III